MVAIFSHVTAVLSEDFTKCYLESFSLQTLQDLCAESGVNCKVVDESLSNFPMTAFVVVSGVWENVRSIHSKLEIELKSLNIQIDTHAEGISTTNTKMNDALSSALGASKSVLAELRAGSSTREITPQDIEGSINAHLDLWPKTIPDLKLQVKQENEVSSKFDEPTDSAPEFIHTSSGNTHNFTRIRSGNHGNKKASLIPAASGSDTEDTALGKIKEDDEEFFPLSEQSQSEVDVEADEEDDPSYTSKSRKKGRPKGRRRKYQHSSHSQQICRECGESYSTKRALRAHVDETHGHTKRKRGRPRGSGVKVKKPTKCPFCDIIVSQKSHLQTHIKRKHSSLEFKCDECEKSYGVSRDLKLHKASAHGPARYYCDRCEKHFSSPQGYNLHMKTHKDGYVPPSFQCNYCGIIYVTAMGLSAHISAVHKGVTFECSLCKKVFATKHTLSCHMNKHSANRKRKFVCEQCGKSFFEKNALTCHKKSHLKVGEFQCDVCLKYFKQKNALKSHKNIHTRTKTFACQVCGREFLQAQALMRHERIHSGAKPFTCSVCFKTFRDDSIVRRHAILIHKVEPKSWKSIVIAEPGANSTSGTGNKRVLPITDPSSEAMNLSEDSAPLNLRDTSASSNLRDTSVPSKLRDTSVPSTSRETSVPLYLRDTTASSNLRDTSVTSYLRDTPAPSNLRDTAAPLNLAENTAPLNLTDNPVPLNLTDSDPVRSLIGSLGQNVYPDPTSIFPSRSEHNTAQNLMRPMGMSPYSVPPHSSVFPNMTEHNQVQHSMGNSMPSAYSNAPSVLPNNRNNTW